MGSNNQPKNSILSLAARSVISKRDREMMQEENKLLEKYYKEYYKGKSSSRSRGGSTNSKASKENSTRPDVHQGMNSIRKYSGQKPVSSKPQEYRQSYAHSADKVPQESKEMSEEEVREAIAKLERK
mmetsp:Transcript_20099/g.19729  ORF Transcript_20099/g.19729 Transcript_20099/m.19729 type:complete len:127 (-) Transcript_20099:178-558(-)